MCSVSWVQRENTEERKKKKREAFCLPTTRFSPIFSFVRYFHAAPLITERLKEGIFVVTLPLISIRGFLNTSDLFYGNSSQLFSVSFCIFTMDDYGKPDMRMFLCFYVLF